MRILLLLIAGAAGLLGQWDTSVWHSHLPANGGGQSIIQGVQGERQHATNGVDVGLSIPAYSMKWEGAAVSGAVENASPVTNAVAGRFYAVASGDGTGVRRIGLWPINGLASDKGFANIIMLTEIDYNITGENTKAIGMSVGGAGTRPPAPGSVAYIANTLGGKGPRIPWPIAYATLPGTARQFSSVGPLEEEPLSPSQPIVMWSRDALGRPEWLQMQLAPGGKLILWFGGPGGAKRKVIQP